MSSQSAELDSAAMAGPIQAEGHYATPHPSPAQEEVDHSQSQVGVWLTVDGGGGAGGILVVVGRVCVMMTVVAGQAMVIVRDS